MGIKLKMMRIYRGLTLKQLALLTGVSPSRISRIERGIYEPRICEWETIIRKLGCEDVTL